MCVCQEHTCFHLSIILRGLGPPWPPLLPSLCFLLSQDWPSVCLCGRLVFCLVIWYLLLYQFHKGLGGNSIRKIIHPGVLQCFGSIWNNYHTQTLVEEDIVEIEWRGHVLRIINSLKPNACRNSSWVYKWPSATPCPRFFSLFSQKVPHLKSSAFEKGCKLDNLYHVKWVYNPC